MDLLTQLGINSTALIQLAIFVVTVFFMRYFVFGPYAKAADERIRRTKGGEDDASEMILKTQTFQQEYEQKARAVNSEISKIFQTKKQEVSAQADSILAGARKDASANLESTRKTIAEEVRTAEVELKKETQQLSALMVKKLLGKTE